MMKLTKSSHKLSRSSRDSPIRKDHLMKKSMHPTSSMRVAPASRPMMKHLSPGMKRGPIITPSKSVHSSRMRAIASPHRSVNRHSLQGSPVTMDRVHGLKRLKYEKRKMSPSPSRRPMPPSVAAMRGSSPYHDERYLSAKLDHHSSHFPPPPTKKKIRREADHGSPPMTMMHRSEMHPSERMLPRSEMTSSRSVPVSSSSHRGGHVAPISDRNNHFHHARGRGRPTSIVPSNHSKRPPPVAKVPFDTQRTERYQSPPPSNRYPSSSAEKHYAPTLHERFSTVVESEPRVKYTREDLEKITIDIHRNLKAESPTVRRIVNPDDVKLVRRANEGHRPIFDREEIKQSSRDMRDEPHFEKKVMSGGSYSLSHSMGLREVENYEITRHRFDSHHQAFHSSSGRSLSDRWQNPAEGRKDGAPLDRDDREIEYERQPMKRSFPDGRVSKAGDRDFRSERYSEPSSSQSRPEYQSSHHMISSSDSRNSSSVHRKAIAPMDARRKLSVVRRGERIPPPSMRPESKNRYPPLEKRYPEDLLRIEKPGDHRSLSGEPLIWKTKRSRSDSREKMPSFSRRPEKYSYKPFPEKSEAPPRSSNYYEDNREVSDSYRGSTRPYRSSRGSRARGFRGSTRGSFPTRSTFRGGYRGRGAPRRGRISPGIWEHDLYMRGHEDH